MTLLFDTSFEYDEGGIPATFDTIVDMDPQQEYSNRGDFSMYAENTTDGGYVQTDDLDGKIGMGTRMYFRIYRDDLSEGDQEMILKLDHASSDILQIYIRKVSGNLVIRAVATYEWTNGSPSDFVTVTDTTPLEVGEWYCLGLRANLNHVGSLILWLEDTIIMSEPFLAWNTPIYLRDYFVYDGYVGKDLNLAYDDMKLYDTAVNHDPNLLCLSYIYEGGPYFPPLDEGEIVYPSQCIQPMNMPYQRLSEALEQIREVCYEAGYELWEWWVDDSDGTLNFGPRKGSDKSATVKFLATFNLGETRHSKDSTQSVQRLKVTGGKQTSKGQDEVTSNWQLAWQEVEDIGGFYESIESKQMAATRETANEWCKILLAQLKDAVEEIEVTIEQDSSPSGSWDVGDDVTLSDSKSNISTAAYRVKRVHVSVNESGEIISLTVTNAWKDITDKIADLYNKLKQMQQSNVGLEDWTAEGTNQNDVRQEKMENLWEVQKRYDSSNELQEVDDITSSDSYGESGHGTNGAGIYMEKDAVEINGRTSDGAVQNTVVWSKTRRVSWDRNPRFIVDFQIVEDGMATNEFINFGLSNESGGGGGTERVYFNVLKTASGHDVECRLRFGNSEVARNIGNVDFTTDYRTGEPRVHTFEAKVNWKDRLVFYYIDEKPVAVISCRDTDFPQDSIDPVASMDLMYILLYASRSGTTTELKFWYWQTQALKPQSFVE